MARYRKRPVVIEAFRFPVDEEPAWFTEARKKAPGVGAAWMVRELGGPSMVVGTLEGVMKVTPGDYVIRGVAGEIYPCKPDIFSKTYEPATKE